MGRMISVFIVFASREVGFLELLSMKKGYRESRAPGASTEMALHCRIKQRQLKGVAIKTKVSPWAVGGIEWDFVTNFSEGSKRVAQGCM